MGPCSGSDDAMVCVSGLADCSWAVGQNTQESTRYCVVYGLFFWDTIEEKLEVMLFLVSEVDERHLILSLGMGSF